MAVCVAVHLHYMKHCCPMSHGRVVGDPCLNGLLLSLPCVSEIAGS